MKDDTMKTKIKKIFRASFMLALALVVLPQELCARATMAFQTNAITVRQTAGSVNIPIIINPNTGSGWRRGSVYVYTSDGTAISGSHFTGIDYEDDRLISLESPDWEPFTGSISIPISYTGSTVDRTFGVNLTANLSYGGADLGAISACSVTILAEPVRPPVYFSLGAASFTVNQSAGSIQIPVTYTGTSFDSQVSISYRTISGTANGTDDYLGTSSSTINFATGSNSAFIVVPIYLTRATVDKSFTVQIFDPSEGQVTSLNTASVTIKGVPAPPPIQFKFGSGNYSVNQTTGSVRIPVTYTGTPRNSQVWLEYNTQNLTGSTGVHYGGTNSSVVNFASGSKTAYISIPIYYSGSTSNRTFRVNLASMSEGVKGSPASTQVTINRQRGLPKIVFKTKRVSVGKRVIEGKIVNVSSKDIMRITLDNLGNTAKVTGKTKWKTKALNFRSRGSYPFVATATLRNGQKITQSINIVVR